MFTINFINDLKNDSTTTVKLTLVIIGTDDMYQPPVNSLKIVEKIPGAWLVQVKNAGHAIMDQYPAEVVEILNTFLSTAPNNWIIH